LNSQSIDNPRIVRKRRGRMVIVIPQKIAAIARNQSSTRRKIILLSAGNRLALI
jgi:hypothetical protein